MLDQITPIVLTYDEEPNLARSLDKLRWAREVLVVDSFSRDRTPELARSFPNVRVLQRAFDDFAAQWSFALREGGLTTPWVLALDADYVLSDALVSELAALVPGPEVAAYRARFRYCVNGRVLRGSLYPPSSVLFRRAGAGYVLDGHAYRLAPGPGVVRELQHEVFHDDRKPFRRWLGSQRRYAAEEADKLRGTPFAALRWPDRVRKIPFAAAPLVGAHCLLVRGGLLDGTAGLRYAGERVLAEVMISAELLRRRRG